MSVGTTMNAARLAMLNKATAVGGPLNNCTLRLFQNNVVPTPGFTLANLTEATFAGYAAIAAQVFGAAYIASDANVHVTAPSQQFVMTTAATPNTIYGWYLSDSANTVFVAGNTFPTPIALTLPSQGLIAQPDVPFGA